jgi:DNA-binding response OmpR family regulator
VISSTELLQEVWECGLETGGGSNNQLKSAIKRLRKKIEPDPKRPVYLITVRGHGYRVITREEWEKNSLMNSLASSES